MSVKEKINQEKTSLMSKEKPYETVAFVIFAVLFIQQIALLMISLVRYLGDWTFFSMANQTTQGFFGRIIALDSSSSSYIALAFLALAFYYALIYVLVYKYSEKKGYAKWTWTLIVVFGPSIFFISPYYIYAAYVFRPYLYTFTKRVIEEFKNTSAELDEVTQSDQDTQV